jgi:hypothetical protein
MSNTTTFEMPPLDLGDPIRRRHYFQGFATGIMGGLIAAMVLPRLFRDSGKTARASAVPAKPQSFEEKTVPLDAMLREAATPIPFPGPIAKPFPDRSFPPYGSDSPNEYSRPELPYGSERSELPIRPDLPNRAARGSNGAANISPKKTGSDRT